MSYRRKAKLLCIIVLISLLVVSILSQIYVYYIYFSTGSWPIRILSSHQIATLIFAVFYFLPLLVLLYKNAKHAGMKKLVIVSAFAIVILLIWIIIMLLAVVQEWVS